MHLPFFLQKFGRDMVYLSIVGAMAIWIWKDRKQQEEWNKFVSIELKEANTALDFMLERAKTTIQEEYYNYPSPKGKIIVQRAYKSRYLLDTVFSNKIENLQKSTSDEFNFFHRNLSKGELKALEKEAWWITDSISKLIDYQELNPKTWSYLFGGNFWEMAQSATSSQTDLLLESLRLRSKMLNREALGYFSIRITGIKCFDFWTPITPVVIADKPLNYSGDTYHAIISLAYRNQIDPSTIIKVDGVTLPHAGNGAVFSEYCTQPGEKRHRITFEVKNPITGEREDYGFGNLFSYYVIDSCR